MDCSGDAQPSESTETEPKAVVNDVEANLRDELFREGSWVADYRRLRFVAVKT